MMSSLFFCFTYMSEWRVSIFGLHPSIFPYGSVPSFVAADGSESGIIQLWSSFFFHMYAI